MVLADGTLTVNNRFIFTDILEGDHMSNGTSEEVIQFMDRVIEVGGKISIDSQEMTIRLYSPHSLKDLIHKLDSIYIKRLGLHGNQL